MAASHTVPQDSEHCNFIPIDPRHGVVTLYGYGIDVRVDRGHLIVHDGIGSRRTTARFARIGHGIRRLVVIGSDGAVTLSALRWLADQDASFVMLDRDGSVLATTGPVRPSDARLRRAQALAYHSETALQIARELLGQKLGAQERLVCEKLRNTQAANAVAEVCGNLASARSIEGLRFLEAQAAKAYWTAWRDVPVIFPNRDLRRIPSHWKVFGTRVSPLTKSPRLAVNPPNAMLNYLYAVLESEARLAIAALGLDPGLGFLHLDSRTRDSLACDLMEPVRPLVDEYVLDWITREPLRREWFFEKPDGNCRLMASFAARLGETAPTWSRVVAPLAEWVSRTLWSTTSKPERKLLPASPLTQSHRRQAKGGPTSLPAKPVPKPAPVCRICGEEATSGHRYCAKCAVTVSRDNLIDVAKLGRVAGHGPEARAKQAEKQRRHAAEAKAWNPADKPAWLTEEVYRAKIQPFLKKITVRVLSSVLGISQPYAAEIRARRQVPHPRHWVKLAQLAENPSDK